MCVLISSHVVDLVNQWMINNILFYNLIVCFVSSKHADVPPVQLAAVLEFTQVLTGHFLEGRGAREQS